MYPLPYSPILPCLPLQLCNTIAGLTYSGVSYASNHIKNKIVDAYESLTKYEKGQQLFLEDHLLKDYPDIHEKATELYLYPEKYDALELVRNLSIIFGDIINITESQLYAFANSKEVLQQMSLISAEILAKVLGSYSPEDLTEKVISFPVIDKDNSISLQDYRIFFAGDLHFDDERRDVHQPYFFLEAEGVNAKNHSTIVVCTPTQYNSKSILGNLSTSGPGYTLYEKSKDIFDQYLNSQESIRVFGYSQGASIAKYIFVDHYHRVSGDQREPSYTFASPNLVPKYTTKLYEKASEDSHSKIKNLHTYFNQHDLVSQINYPIGNIYVIENGKEKILSPLTAHTGIKSTDTNNKIYKLGFLESKKWKRYLLSFFAAT